MSATPVQVWRDPSHRWVAAVRIGSVIAHERLTIAKTATPAEVRDLVERTFPDRAVEVHGS